MACRNLFLVAGWQVIGYGRNSRHLVKASNEHHRRGRVTGVTREQIDCSLRVCRVLQKFVSYGLLICRASLGVRLINTIVVVTLHE
jgi:hypothetical protein